MSLIKEQRLQLIRLAKDSIAYGLENGRPLKPDAADYDDTLQQIRATFVTLEINHQLRGCIGMLEAVRPLFMDVAENAFSAAFRDPRFPPVSEEEYPKLEYHISILTPSEPVCFESEADLIQKMRPNIDGLILQEGRLRGTFLPSVWESLPKPEDFLQHLKQKAGLPRHYWSDTLKVFRYECEIIAEE